MDESLNERIDRLRERSRFFLAQVEENSKKVKELRKLYSQSLWVLFIIMFHSNNVHNFNKSCCL